MLTSVASGREISSSTSMGGSSPSWTNHRQEDTIEKLNLMLKCSGCREPVPSRGQHCNLGDPEGVGHPSRHHCICSGTDTLRVSDTLHYVYRAKIFANSHFLIHLDSHLEHGIFVDWSATSAQVQKRAVFVVVENAGNIVPNDHIINIHCTSIEFTSIPLT